MNYYCSETKLMYVRKNNIVFTFPICFKEMCKNFYNERPIWVTNFGRNPMGIRYEYNTLLLKPCPQAPSEYLNNKIKENEFKNIDWDKTFKVMSNELHQYCEDLVRTRFKITSP